MSACELCRREVGGVTRHYLMPRARHQDKKNKKNLAHDGVTGRPVDLCRPCHKKIHKLTHQEAVQYF